MRRAFLLLCCAVGNANAWSAACSTPSACAHASALRARGCVILAAVGRKWKKTDEPVGAHWLTPGSMGSACANAAALRPRGHVSFAAISAGGADEPTSAAAAGAGPWGDDKPTSAVGVLWQMTRPKTLPQSVVLLLLGAYGVEHNVNFLFNAVSRSEFGLLSVLVVLTTATSMLVNDYFDYGAGNDTPESNAQGALVQGLVTAETVKAVCKWLYALHLGLTLLVREPSVRLCVYLNTLATFLYSRHFKPVPLLKNALCATVIATTVALGATVVKGSMNAAVRSVWPLMLVVGCGIAHREMVMDVSDIEGDAKAGVQTVPVLVGARPALALSCAPLLLPIAAALFGKGISMLAALPFVAMCALAAGAASHKVHSDASKASIGSAVELAPLWILLSLIGTLRS